MSHRARSHCLSPAVRSFLDGLAELIAEDLLREMEGRPLADTEHDEHPIDQRGANAQGRDLREVLLLTSTADLDR
jgi:hypothetical protein